MSSLSQPWREGVDVGYLGNWSLQRCVQHFSIVMAVTKKGLALYKFPCLHKRLVSQAEDKIVQANS